LSKEAIGKLEECALDVKVIETGLVSNVLQIREKETGKRIDGIVV